MKTIKYLFITVAFMLSVGTAMAGTDDNVTTMDGFHALSQVTNAEAQTLTALTDEQLGDIEGGRIADYDSVSSWAKWVLPYIRIAATLEPDPEPWKFYHVLEPDPVPWSPSDISITTKIRY